MSLKWRAYAVLAGLAGLSGNLGAAWGDRDQGIPWVEAFDVAPVNAKGAVWAFGEAGEGRIWVGEDEAMLFDGYRTVSVKGPEGAYGFKGFGRDGKGGLWTGAVGAVGRLVEGQEGGWTFVPATRELEAAGIDTVGEILAVYSIAGGVVFVEPQRVLVWNGSDFRRWPLPSATRLVPCGGKKEAWVYQPGAGLLRVRVGGPERVIEGAALPATPVVWVLESEKGRPEVIGAADSVYSWEDSGWKRSPALSQVLAGKLPFCAARLGRGVFAVGTFLGGVVIGSDNDQVLQVLDRDHGLPSDNIHSLWSGKAKELWVGYEGGMARIEGTGVVSVFDRQNGLSELPVLKVIEAGGVPLGLTRGALRSLGGAQGTPDAGVPKAYLWDAASEGSDIFVSGFGGVWKKGPGWEQIHTSAADIYRVRPEGGGLLMLEGTRLSWLLPSPHGGWADRDLDVDFGEAPLSWTKDGEGDLWVSTISRGIFRLRKSEDNSQYRKVEHIWNGSGIPANLHRPRLTTLGGSVFALTREGAFAWRNLQGEFVPVGATSGFVPLGSAVSSDPSVGYWLMERSNSAQAPVIFKVQTKDEVSATPFAAPGIERAGRIESVSFAAGALWVGGTQALLRFDPSLLAAPAAPPSLAVGGTFADDRPLFLPEGGSKIQLPAASGPVRFELLGTNRADGTPLQIEYRLNEDPWSVPQKGPEVRLSGLSAGSYAFRARTVDSLGRRGPVVAVGFAIAAPWYLSARAYVAYGIALFFLVFVGFQWRLGHLRGRARELQELVDERTRELALANSAKSEFLENVSHEIRNPLNGISGLVELLKDAELKEDERKLASALRVCTENLTQVFEEVLSFSKLEYGYLAMEERAFDLQTLVGDLAALFALPAQKAGCEIAIHWPDGTTAGPWFRGDAEKIRTILGNFLGNAIKYAPGKPVGIGVGFERPKGSGKIPATISVTDQGMGISPVEEGLIFNKFVRGRSAKTSGAPGTGLGLAACKALATALGGTVGVATPPGGRGAAFWLRLPLQEVAAGAALASAGSEAAAAHVNGELRGLRALIVEDQDYNQIVLKGIARKLGCEPDVAGTAREARERIQRQTYDVVFLDWELPDGRGETIAQELRKERGESLGGMAPLILATTAHDSDEIRQKCREAGMDGFALKPFNAPKIAAAVAAAKRARAGGPDCPPPETVAEPEAALSGTVSFAVFEDFARGDPARASEAVSIFLKILDAERAAIADAFTKGEMDQVARAAHRLRSHASLIGGGGLASAAKFLQEMAETGPTEAVKTEMARVATQAESLKAAVQAHAPAPKGRESGSA